MGQGDGKMRGRFLPLLLLSLVFGVGDGEYRGRHVLLIEAVVLQGVHGHSGMEAALKLHEAEGVHSIGILCGNLRNHPG